MISNGRQYNIGDIYGEALRSVQRKRRGGSMPSRNVRRATMRTSNSHQTRTNDEMIQFPSHEELELQIAKARQARSAFLRQCVAGSFAALDRRFHQGSAATS